MSTVVDQVALLQEGIAALTGQLDEFEAAREAVRESGIASRVLTRLLDDTDINHGDTGWVLLSSVVVMMMTTPGIMLYYAGSVRIENVLATAMQGFALACLVTFLWTLVGYSIAFSPATGQPCAHSGGWFIGDGNRVWLDGVHVSDHHSLANTVPETAFCIYQLAFAIITPALISGAMVDRMKFGSLLVSLGLWHLLVYCPVAHIFWHPDGFLFREGTLDFAGGCVVHISAGVSALVGTVVIGQREGYGRLAFHPHNMLVSITGACFLWLGWFGFNAGSALVADSSAGIAFLNTQISSSSAALAWMAAEVLSRNRPSIPGLMNGSISGLVAITPCSGYVDPSGAFFVGLCGGVACFFGVKIKHQFRFDDPCDCFGIHTVGGVVGSLLLGLLAKESVNGVEGTFYGHSSQLLKQLYGVLFTIAYSATVTATIFVALDRIIGLRLSKHQERSGMDRVVHNTNMYSQLSLSASHSASSLTAPSQPSMPALVEMPVAGTRSMPMDTI